MESLNKLQTKYEENQNKTVDFYKKTIENITDETQKEYLNSKIVGLYIEMNTANDIKPALIYIDFKIKNSGQLKLLRPLIIISFVTLFLIFNFILIFYFRNL